MNMMIFQPYPKFSGVENFSITEWLSMAVFLLIVVAVSIASGRYTANRFKTSKVSTVLIFVSVEIVVAILMLCFFGLSARSIAGIIYCLLLLISSYSDIITRECDDWISVMILLAGLINTQVNEIPYRLVAIIFTAVIILLPTLFKCEGIGGADIKIACASAFLMGLCRSLVALVAGLVAAIILNGIRHKKTGFPLLPYFSVTYMAAYFL